MLNQALLDCLKIWGLCSSDCSMVALLLEIRAGLA